VAQVAPHAQAALHAAAVVVAAAVAVAERPPNAKLSCAGSYQPRAAVLSGPL
jgi:hypothetical protein